MPVWTGIYTDSDRVAKRLQGRLIMTNSPQPNSVTPIISDELITCIGNQAEAEITNGLYSLGYCLPLTLTSEVTRNLLAAVAEKEIIYQLLISTDLKAECSCLDGVSLEDLDRLIQDYGSTLEEFLAGIKSCAIVLQGECKNEVTPCQTATSSALKQPTSIGVITKRSQSWRPPHTFNF